MIPFPLSPDRVGQAEGSIDCPETARRPIEILPPESCMNILTEWVRFGWLGVVFITRVSKATR